jgi:hypothetical protein
MISNTQFVWRNVLAMPDVIKPSKKKPNGNDCWLCGGDAGENALALKDAISSGFTDSNLSKAPHSDAVCQSCAALMSRDAWVLACEKHGHSPHFPEVEGKTQKLASWMFSSHLFSEERGWIRPSRNGVRDVLLAPPENGKWVLTLAATGKKHVIFRAPINNGGDDFFVQFDEHTLLVHRRALMEIIDVFEDAYSLGLSKDSLLTGRYNQAACVKIGVQKWRYFEEKLSGYRKRFLNEMRLAHFCGQKNDIGRV